VSDPLADRTLYLELQRKYLVWDAFVGGARRVDLHPLLLTPKLHARAVRVAEDAWRVVSHLAERALDDAEELARYGLSPDAVALARAARRGGDHASFVRVDLLLSESGDWHACEVNVDSPGGHNEAVGLPSLALEAGLRGADVPGNPLSALVDRLCSQSAELESGTIGLVHATAHAEDLQIAALLRRELRVRGHDAMLIPPTALREEGARLCARSRPLSTLYRYYPTEHMQGLRNVGELVRCLERGAVRSLTSFAWYPAQSKFAYARAWAQRAVLHPSLTRAVESALPFTLDVAALPVHRLLAERREWVLKRALGRVGDQVVVGELTDEALWANVVDDVLAFRAHGERWIAQRCVPQRALETPWGPRLVTLGAYLCDGRFSGYFARLSARSHVSHDALCVPVFVERDAVE
jgi:glutathionylspermidine synthase